MSDRSERDAAARAQQLRAERAIAAIFAGGDLASETLNLSNEFTDRQTARLSKLLRREQTGVMSNDTPREESTPDTPEAGSNATGSQSTSAETYDIVNSGQSDDIENSLTGQGTSDRETTREANRSETDGAGGGGGARGR